MTAPGLGQRAEAFCESQELPRAGAEGLQLVEFAAGLLLGLPLTFFGLCCAQEISFPALGAKTKIKIGEKNNFERKLALCNLKSASTAQKNPQIWSQTGAGKGSENVAVAALGVEQNSH